MGWMNLTCFQDSSCFYRLGLNGPTVGSRLSEPTITWSKNLPDLGQRCSVWWHSARGALYWHNCLLWMMRHMLAEWLLASCMFWPWWQKQDLQGFGFVSFIRPFFISLNARKVFLYGPKALVRTRSWLYAYLHYSRDVVRSFTTLPRWSQWSFPQSKVALLFWWGRMGLGNGPWRRWIA